MQSSNFEAKPQMQAWLGVNAQAVLPSQSTVAGPGLLNALAKSVLTWIGRVLFRKVAAIAGEQCTLQKRQHPHARD